jgi:ABC-type uncharacterized transport system permease subunit
MELNLFVDVLQVAMPVLYGVLVLLYGITFFWNIPSVEGYKTPLLSTTIVLHAVYLAVRTAAFDHPPITSVFEIMTMLALCIAVAYLYIEVRSNASTTGVLILALAFIFQAVSSLFIRALLVIPEYLHSLVLGFHVSAALLGYTGISLSAAYGFLYLMLYREVKAANFGTMYQRLPNLETLEKMSHRAEVLGFVMLSVAILIGLFWLPRVFADFSYWDPKLVGSVVIWLLYAVGLAAKRRFGWQGRRMMILTLVAFCFVFLSMTVINLYLSGFHSFH